MSNGRYGAKSANMSTDAELAEIRAELRNQGKGIAKLDGKIDVISESVTTMSVQMGHLVTKESCSEGRVALARDLKSRMDSKRDITGVDLPIKDLVREYVKQGKPTPVPYKEKPLPSISSISNKIIEHKTKERGASFWIGLISGILAIIGAVYVSVVFIDRTVQRQDRTEQLLLQMQKQLSGSSEATKQLPANQD